MFGAVLGALGPSLSKIGEQVVGGGINLLSNRYSAQRQESFQQNMSSTAYQRAVQDMRQAGINPMLAYSQGGASSPSGFGGSANIDMSGAVSTALESKRLNAEIDSMREGMKTQETQQQLNKALEKETKVRTGVHSSTAKNLDAKTQSVILTQPENEAKSQLWGVASDVAKGAVNFYKAVKNGTPLPRHSAKSF